MARGVECLRDANWTQLVTRPVGGSAAYEWTPPNQWWRGNGEPWEGRAVEMLPRNDGARALRIAGSRADQIGQWQPAIPNRLYLASVKVRAHVSPGTATFLLVSFLDEKQHHIGLGRIDRVPVSDQVQELELDVIVRAPANARFVGVGLRVLGQLPNDFVEFSSVSLRTPAN
jgi:hypothetical protein